MKIIAVANQKGGVAKTTTACAFAVALKNRGFRVLAIDMDPSGNLSVHANAERNVDSTIYEVLKKEVSAMDAIQHTASVDIIAANIELVKAEHEFTHTGREHRLREVLDPVRDRYDYIVIDTPPTLGMNTVMAFTCADEVIIPTKADRFSTEGLALLKESIDNVKKYTNHNLEVAGILITIHSARSKDGRIYRDVIARLSDAYQYRLFKTFIRLGAKATSEAQTGKTDIFTWDPKSKIAEDYMAFLEEYLGRE